jgi:hypothetical protein
MIKEIIIDGKKTPLNATVGALVRYKENFGTDYFDDLRNTQALAETESAELQSKTVNDGVRLAWAMSGTQSSYGAWIAGATGDEVVAAAETATELFFSSIGSAEESQEEYESDGMTVESLLACCLVCGISLADAESKSVGIVMNTISAYVDLKSGTEKERVKVATQADFDAF